MKRSILYMFVLLCFFGACTEDLGNYDYVEVNEISIDALLDQRLEVSQVLHITPTVVCSQAGRELEYLWYRYIGKTLEVDTISTEEVLDWKVNLTVGEYDIYLKVTDKNSGLSGKTLLKLKVVGQFDTGLLVLGEKNGMTDLLFINDAGNAITIYDADQNAGIAKHPVALGNTIVPYGSLKDILLLCDDGGGGMVLENADFSPKCGILDQFYLAPKVINPEAYYKALEYGQNAQADYIINDGKLHARSTSEDFVSGKRGSFSPYMSGDYYLSPYAIVNGSVNLFYDNKNGRFLVVPITMWGLQEDFSLLNSSDAAFDPSAIGGELVYMAEGKGEGQGYYRNARGYGIFRNKQNQLERLIFTLENYNQGKRTMNLIDRSPVSVQAVGIDEASGYAMSLAQPFMYYSKGSKIYSYDLINNNCYAVYDTDTIPELSNSTIDKIYMEYAIHYNGFGSDAEEYNKTLYVSSSRESEGKKSGTIHVLNLADNGTVESRQALYKNVCEKTVSMVYKR